MNKLLLKDAIVYKSDGFMAFPKGEYVTCDQYEKAKKDLKESNLKIDKLNLALTFCKSEKKTLEDRIKILEKNKGRLE